MSVRSPLFSFYQEAYDFHFYTADPDEKANLIKQPGWKEYARMGYVFRQSPPGTVPLFRLFKALARLSVTDDATR